MNFMYFLANLNMTFITFLFIELILSIAFTKDWKFRFNKAKRYPNLIPRSKSWKVTWVFLILTFVVLPIITALLWFVLPNLLTQLRFLQLNVLFFISPLVYLWAKLKIIDLKNICWWDSIPIAISVVSGILLGVFVYYHIGF